MRANRDRMRESIELVPVTSAPVGTTIKLPLDRPRTIQYMFTQCIIFKGTNKYVCVCVRVNEECSYVHQVCPLICLTFTYTPSKLDLYLYAEYIFEYILSPFVGIGG